MAAVNTAQFDPQPWNMTLPERLKRARLAAGVTADEMAQVLECTDRTIRNYESGATPIKPREIRDWSMRCGGARVHRWVTTGEVPTPDNGPDLGSTHSGCNEITPLRPRRPRESDTYGAPARRAS